MRASSPAPTCSPPAPPPSINLSLKAGKQVAEANEGLAILAMRDGNTEDARHYMEAARTAGTHNVVALTEYGIMTKDSERAIAILKEALTVDPKYPEAHWALGEKISDPRRRLAEWKQAVALAPRRYEWWEKYASLCIDQKQYAEAGRAWIAAAQAAPRFRTSRALSRFARADRGVAARR